MLDSLFGSIKFFFTFTIIAFVVIIVIVAIVKGKEHYKYKESKRKNEEDMLNGINKIKTASKRWNRELKLNYMDYLAEEYDKLEKANNKPFGEGWSCKTVIMANINGDIDYFSADLDALYDLYHYIDRNLNK